MDSPIINTISLCTGVGMLDEAFRLGCEYFGWRTKPALYCEWDSYAAACLLARMEEQSLEPGPIWCGDLRALDCRPFRGSVGALLAGFPCQPFSVAGLQLGHEDERNIWPDIIRTIRQTQPDLILLENVPGLASTRTIHHRPDLLAHFARLDAAIKSAPSGRDKWQRSRHRERLYRRLLREEGVSALLYVEASLEAIDYIVEEPLFVTAESVGASHRRERVVILAHRNGGRFAGLRESSRCNGQSERGDEILADAGLQHGIVLKRRDGAEHPGSGGVVADTQQQPGSAELRTRSRRRAGAGPRDESMPGGRCRPVGSPTSGGGRIDEPRQGSDRRTVIGGPSEKVEYTPSERTQISAICSRSQERRSERRDAESQFQAAERSGSAIFAPGPGADWASIPEHLWPAVEPGFRVLVDELAVFLDLPASDFTAQWREELKRELKRLCGPETRPTIEAGWPEVSGVRRDREANRRAPPRHSEPAVDRDLSVSQVPCEGGPAGGETMEESAQARTEKAVSRMQSTDERAAPSQQVLQPQVRDQIQGEEGCESNNGNANNLPCLQPRNSRADSKGTAILHKTLRDYFSEHPIDEYRTDQLRCGGNGVVPLAIAAAFVELVRRAV